MKWICYYYYCHSGWPARCSQHTFTCVTYSFPWCNIKNVHSSVDHHHTFCTNFNIIINFYGCINLYALTQWNEHWTQTHLFNFNDFWKLIPDRIKSLVIRTHITLYKEKINKIKWNKITNKSENEKNRANCSKQ